MKMQIFDNVKFQILNKRSSTNIFGFSILLCRFETELSNSYWNCGKRDKTTSNYRIQIGVNIKYQNL